MTYAKPEVVLNGSALDAVQSQVKGQFQLPDSIPNTTDPRHTNGAYEADE